MHLKEVTDTFSVHPWTDRENQNLKRDADETTHIIKRYFELRTSVSARQAALMASALPVQSEVAA